MLAARLLGEPTAGLKDVVLRHYGVRMITYDDVTLGRKRSIRDAPPEQVAEYCSGDCYWGVRATTDLVTRLSGQALKLYTDTDLPLVRTLVNMELRGIQLDVDSTTKALADADEKLLALRGAIGSLARESGYVRPDTRRVCRMCRNGKNKRITCDECKGAGVFFSPNPLNPGSTAQLVDWLHGHLNIPIQALSRNTGAASVDALALLRMQDAHPAIPILLNWRAIDRYRTFLIGWLEDAQHDGRIRTNFTMSFTKSGRLSSRDPNLQQVSRPWRRHFVAPEGHVLVCADYTALEVRIAAFASRDSTLLAVMNADPSTLAGDLHGQNVQKLFNVPYEDQDERPDLRVRAKNYMFGAMYGSMGQEVQAVLEKAILANPSLGTPPSVREISRAISNIHDIYSHYFREWVPFMIERAREQDNTAHTCFGRPRVIPDLTSGYKQQREAAERMCISQIIQGTAADIGRMACNLVDGLAGGWLLLQIHDELISQTLLDDKLDNYKADMIQLMCLGQPLEGVPLIVKVGVGSTWLDAK
jgi:DNA polymerase I-like protein with 3'-5' exonuclease and polymerase domains